MFNFKKGDKVRCVKGFEDQFTTGNIYTVQGIENADDRYSILSVVRDDLGNTDNGWLAVHFELVEVKTPKVNYHVLNDSIVLNYSGKTKVIACGDNRYNSVLDCIREKRFSDLPDIVEIERKYNQKGIEVKDGLFTVNNEPLPAELETRIMKFKEMKLPFDALLKFWDNLKKNPSFNARKMLFAFIENNGHPLTDDGCFIAYRGVTEDFKDKYTRTFDNNPGSVCAIDRSLVDDNPNNTCSTGLHVACFDYARSFGPKLIEVKVNPADVVCVPTDYNGTKMRTCRFEVIQECDAINDSVLEILHPVKDDEENFNDNEYDNLDSFACEDESDEEENESENYRHAVRGSNGRFVKSK